MVVVAGMPDAEKAASLWSRMFERQPPEVTTPILGELARLAASGALVPQADRSSLLPMLPRRTLCRRGTVVGGSCSRSRAELGADASSADGIILLAGQDPLRRDVRLRGARTHRQPRAPRAWQEASDSCSSRAGRRACCILADVSIVAGVLAGRRSAAVRLPRARGISHPFWQFTDPAARRTQEGGFYRVRAPLGAALALFAFFTTMGHLPFAVTGPPLNLR